MKRAAVNELRSEGAARQSPLGRLRADSHGIEEVSQRDIHPAIELLDEMTPRSEDKEEVLTPINDTDEDCSWLFESQSPGVLEGVCNRLWWHSISWHDLDERRKDWLSNHESFKPATTNDLMSSLNPDLCKFCRIFFDDVRKDLPHSLPFICYFNSQLIFFHPFQFAIKVSWRESSSTLLHLTNV
jgi:hypothetical protein